MRIRIDSHTLERALERGANQNDIREVIETGTAMSARHGRIRKCKVFDFRRLWLGRYYEQKRVEVIYVVEDNAAVTVTVYVFYGKWE